MTIATSPEFGASPNLVRKFHDQFKLSPCVIHIDDLAAAADRLAASIAANPPWAVQGTLRAIWAAQDLGSLGGRSIATALLSTATDKDALRSGTEQFDSGGRVEPRIR